MLQSLLQGALAIRSPGQPAASSEPVEPALSGGFAALIDQLAAISAASRTPPGEEREPGKNAPAGGKILTEGKILPDLKSEVDPDLPSGAEQQDGATVGAFIDMPAAAVHVANISIPVPIPVPIPIPIPVPVPAAAVHVANISIPIPIPIPIPVPIPIPAAAGEPLDIDDSADSRPRVDLAGRPAAMRWQHRNSAQVAGVPAIRREPPNQPDAVRSVVHPASSPAIVPAIVPALARPAPGEAADVRAFGPSATGAGLAGRPLSLPSPHPQAAVVAEATVLLPLPAVQRLAVIAAAGPGPIAARLAPITTEATGQGMAPEHDLAVGITVATRGPILPPSVSSTIATAATIVAVNPAAPPAARFLPRTASAAELSDQAPGQQEAVAGKAPGRIDRHSEPQAEEAHRTAGTTTPSGRSGPAPLASQPVAEARTATAPVAKPDLRSPDAPLRVAGDEVSTSAQALAARSDPVASEGRAATPSIPSHAATPSARQALPHDFSELVDRLIEARDAAAPRIVRAAITHGEFGTVSLQLDNQAHHLRVTMASTDPGFAPAAQAAALAASAAGPENDTPRQAAQPQQNSLGGGAANGTLSGDASQRSADTGRQGRHQDEPPGRRQSGDRAPDNPNTTSRNGIYA